MCACNWRSDSANSAVVRGSARLYGIDVCCSKQSMGNILVETFLLNILSSMNVFVTIILKTFALLLPITLKHLFSLVCSYFCKS